MTRTYRRIAGLAAGAALSGLAAGAAQAQSNPLNQAAAAIEDERTGEARSILSAVDPSSLSPAAQARYFELRGRLDRFDNPSRAAQFYARANAIEERAFRRYEEALAHDRAGALDAAIAAFERARALDPGNVNILLSEAYALRRAGRDAQAAERFRQARAAGAGDVNVVLDQGYAELAAGDGEAAASSFREGVDLMNADPATDPTRLYGVRREIQQIEDRFGGFAFVSYREESFDPGLALPEQGVSFGQVGAEAEYRPEGLFEAGKGVSVFARGFATFEDGSLEVRDETLQLGAGVRWKPFAAQNFNLTGERLIAAGDLARDAWLARISYGWSDGIDWRAGETDWNYTVAYADAAHIFDDPEFTSLYGSFRQGRRFAVGEKTAVTPYVVAVAQWSDDDFAERERFEAGVGVAFSVWFDETTYTAPAQRLDFEVEYRAASGDADDSLLARVLWSF